jgi:hypothetical protein
MKIHEILTEGLSHKRAEIIIDAFVKFAKNHLNLDQTPSITLNTNPQISATNKSFGGYGNGRIQVSISNRHINDCLRSLAHEMVHFKQDLNNELKADSGNDGSDIENFANSEAAVIMRKWGKQHPNLFKAQAID